MFAKLYKTKLGQILVKFDTDGDECNPEVRFYFRPDGLGVCSTAIVFNDDDSGWDKAEKLFNEINKKRAVKTVTKIIEHISS